MSLVIGCTFPDGAILFSDSRISIKTNLQESYRDELRKLFQLGKNLAIGFTSNNVKFTHELLKRMTYYSLKKSRSQNTLHLLDKMLKVAKFEYKKISNQLRITPAMEFIYSGVINGRSNIINGKDMMKLLNSIGSGSLSPRLYYGIKNSKNGVVTLPPPATILAKQKFPSGDSEILSGIGYAYSGMNNSIEPLLEEAFFKILGVGEEANIKFIILTTLVDKYCKDKKIKTIGGMVQSLFINENGVFPQNYSYTQFDSDGKPITTKSIFYNQNKWIQKNSKTGQEVIIKENPLYMLINNIFET